ncbi:hypothetical protein [Rhodovarius sp.]|uniref:hypothetical protein n=1 Tax=Rhodovarius sp. TaxID=2972673 RepID=UPI00333E6288
MLQVDELRRAMGFGEDYILDQGSRRDKIKMLGNGVCPPVMQSVVSALISQAPHDQRPRASQVVEPRIPAVQLPAPSAISSFAGPQISG